MPLLIVRQTVSTYVANLTQTGKIGSGKNTKSLHIYTTGLKVHLKDISIKSLDRSYFACFGENWPLR